MICVAPDLPLFYYFMFSKLAAFKVFFWKRNMFNFPDDHSGPFGFDSISGNDLDKASKMLRSYLKVPTIEIWSEETLNPTLRQINFFNETGMFQSRQDVFDILEDLKKVVDHIRRQAELGYKFYPDNENVLTTNRANFKIYRNDIPLSENVLLVKFENFNVVHLGHNVLNFLTTSNEYFFNDTLTFIDRVMKNSTLISVSAEKERKRFFNLIHHKIDALIANL
ncbi:MAG: hypothetical protein MI975_04230 [Cytophagales bacterium]|nr:hypothetical protein [Cytophagales bacterium]